LLNHPIADQIAVKRKAREEEEARLRAEREAAEAERAARIEADRAIGIARFPDGIMVTGRLREQVAETLGQAGLSEFDRVIRLVEKRLAAKPAEELREICLSIVRSLNRGLHPTTIASTLLDAEPED
jgi:hypothetical protein